MDGVAILFIGIYFFPSAVALLRSHRNLTAIFIINLLLGWTVIGWVVALVWSAANGPSSAVPQVVSPAPNTPQPQPEIPDATQAALRIIRAGIEACQRSHADAIHVMAVVAQADGKISRNDLKIMFEFCAKQGTVLPENIDDAMPHFNAGVTMNIEGDVTCPTAFAELEQRPMLYLTGLHGSLTAMTIGAKRKNKTTIDLMTRLEELIQRRAGQPDPVQSKATELSITITDNLPEQPPEPVQPAVAAKPPAPEPPPKPAPFKPQSWVDKARQEIAAERQR